MSSRALAMQHEQQAAGEPGGASTNASATPAMPRWAEAYKEQRQGRPSSQEAAVLPVMTLSKVKLPTESVPLQIFEPRYRLLFKLVNSSASRRFGVVLADKSSGMMESGAWHGSWRGAAGGSGKEDHTRVCLDLPCVLPPPL